MRQRRLCPHSGLLQPFSSPGQFWLLHIRTETRFTCPCPSSTARAAGVNSRLSCHSVRSVRHRRTSRRLSSARTVPVLTQFRGTPLAFRGVFSTAQYLPRNFLSGPAMAIFRAFRCVEDNPSTFILLAAYANGGQAVRRKKCGEGTTATAQRASNSGLQQSAIPQWIRTMRWTIRQLLPPKGA